MSRYPRNARSAAIKCISCNAPVTETIDNEYICVECGESPIKRRLPTTVTTSREGLWVEKTLSKNGNAAHRVKLEIHSDCDDRVAIRLFDPIPEQVQVSDVQFGSEPDDQFWTRSQESISYHRIIEPGERVQTTYEIGGESSALSGTRITEPEFSEINQLAEKSASNGGVASSGEPTESDPEVTANGGSAAVLASTADSVQSNVEAAAITKESPERTAVQPTERGLLVPPDSEIDPMISVVLPTMNEEEGIGPCIDAIVNALGELELPGEVIVSDSSTDRTAEIAREHGARVVTPDKKGYGYAYRYAFQYARGEFVVIGDADTTYDFEELPKLFRLVAEDGVDMAMGSRLNGEIKPGAMPWLHQYIGNPLLTKFLNIFYDAGVSDAHSGFRVIRRDTLEQLNLNSHGMEFASEMVMEAGAKGFSIGEVPITYHERVGEATLESFRDGWRHVKFMLTNAPSYLFSIPAAVLGLIGLLTMAIVIGGVSINGMTFGTHVLIAGSLLTIVGYQVGSLAIFSAVAGDPIRKPNDAVTRWITDHFKLEHGATLGLILYAIGAGYVTLMIINWVNGGYGALPTLQWDIVAFTFIILGVQTVFYSFFLSLIGQTSENV